MSNIKKSLIYLKNKFYSSEYLSKNKQELDYRYNHILRVASISEKIAEKENLDKDILVIGALFHDISYIYEFKTKEDHINHGRNSAKIVENFLNTLNLTDYQKEQILLGIAIHVDGKQGDFVGEASIEAKSVGDSDNIDRFDIYRIFEIFNYDKFYEKNIEEKINYLNEKLTRIEKIFNYLDEFVTETSKNMFLEKLNMNKYIFNNLLTQLAMSKKFEKEIK